MHYLLLAHNVLILQQTAHIQMTHYGSITLGLLMESIMKIVELYRTVLRTAFCNFYFLFHQDKCTTKRVFIQENKSWAQFQLRLQSITINTINTL